ncbi:MAG: family 43 glycosylhydrolase [Bacteroidales bacterium]|nr:family 43 glycosylhydrolase [Bacteroidales bacterium]
MKTIKNIYLIAGACATMLLSACSGMDGDGINEFDWEGSRNPENTSYRNPVWEPSLASGTVLKAASLFAAISPETQWAKGIDYCCPAITSSDLMSWSFNSQFGFTALTEEEDGTVSGTRPNWITGEITELSADFAKTVSGANYWMVYCDASHTSIGAASSTSGQGPYTDMGCFLTAEELGCTTVQNPFIIVASTKFYVCYTTENGSYIQQVNLRKGQTPSKMGTAKLIAGAQWQQVSILRRDASDLYLIGTVATASGTEIRYGRAEDITGPYTDKSGQELTASTGDLLIQGNDTNINPCNAMRAFESENGYIYIAYNATAVGREKLESGYDRKPLFLTPAQIDEDGYFTSVLEPVTGWVTPRYQ